MRTTRREFAGAVCAGAVGSGPVCTGQTPGYPPKMDGAEELYKSVDGVALRLWVYSPEGHKASDRRAGIVFFFGGGWTNGSPKQFEPQCKHLAARGMVAMTADYRVASRQNAKIVDCVQDAESAVQWVRANAGRLGIDPARLAAGGGSAGGHLAAVTGVMGRGDARPNALVLFNPVLVMAAEPGAGANEKFVASIRARMGALPEVLSPWHHVEMGVPPTLILHGKNDTTVPYQQAEAFREKMRALGNQCELEGYEGQAHGFFNPKPGDDEYYRKTLRRADDFLVSLGYLKPGN